MIPGGDHSSRSLLFRRVRSYSEVSLPTPENEATRGSGNDDGDDHSPSRPRSNSTSSPSDGVCNDEDSDLMTPLLPQGLSLEYEEESQESLVDNDGEENSNLLAAISSANWRLWLVFGLLVASGVGNVIFAKLQSLPMYNYPTFLNIYANGMYVVMSFAYIIPASALGLFGNSITRSIPSKAMKPFFVMGALDAFGAAMQFLATIYLPGTLLVLIPQVAIPLSMAASSLVLREKYTRRQYIGACVVFLGILVVLYPILSHQRDAEYYCQAIDTEDDCLLCKEELTKEKCLSHNANGDGTNHTSTQQQFWRAMEFFSSDNSTDNDSEGLYCAWVSREEADVREEDFLEFFWSIVMLLSCVPSVLSTVYKQVAVQTATFINPIVISGWVSLFQLLCGLFLVVPSGLVSSPRLQPLDIGPNWRDGIGCLFAKINSVETGCHPDDCSRAALWVHLSLANSVVYALSMLFVLKYGSCDLMYLGLTLVVPLGHLAFDIHSSFADLRAYDLTGLGILVAGLVLYRFGHSDNESTSGNDDPRYDLMMDQEENVVNNLRNSEAGDDASNNAEGLNHDREGFLEFLREPFMLVGDI